MDWVETPESSTIARFRYDADSQILTVDFKNGTVYQYFDVPQSCYDEFCTSPSKGKFLSSTIKGRYRFARA